MTRFAVDEEGYSFFFLRLLEERRLSLMALMLMRTGLDIRITTFGEFSGFGGRDLLLAAFFGGQLDSECGLPNFESLVPLSGLLALPGLLEGPGGLALLPGLLGLRGPEVRPCADLPPGFFLGSVKWIPPGKTKTGQVGSLSSFCA